MNTAVENRGWPVWVWMIVILQVATLVLVIVPWLVMMGAMMSGGAMMGGHASPMPQPTASPR